MAGLKAQLETIPEGLLSPYVTSTLNAINSLEETLVSAGTMAKECHQLMMHMSFCSETTPSMNNIADGVSEFTQGFLGRAIDALPQNKKQAMETVVNETMSNCAQVMYRTQMQQMNGQITDVTVTATINELKRRNDVLIDQLLEEIAKGATS